jgi:hypothetical protein
MKRKPHVCIVDSRHLGQVTLAAVNAKPPPLSLRIVGFAQNQY